MTENQKLILDGPADSALTVIFAHGAGAPMDSPFMAAFAEGLGKQGWQVVRFEFSYMAERRQTGKRRPPSPQARLLNEWRDVLASVNHPGKKLVIGGKSMGGRMASLLADESQVNGLVCLGYPFHPPGKPEKLRTEHLAELSTPALFVQGTRDALGSRDEIEGYRLAPGIRFHWAEDGDHSLKPRKASGFTEAGHWQAGIDAIDQFLRGILRS
ncbi:MAG: alpha/beta family hydrolase [Pseudomonadota bacterium]